MLPDLSRTGDPRGGDRPGRAGVLQAVVDEPLRWHTILVPIGQNPGPVRRRLEDSRALIRAQMEPLFAWGLEQRNVQHEIDVDLLARLVLAGSEEAGRVTKQFFEGTSA